MSEQQAPRSLADVAAAEGPGAAGTPPLQDNLEREIKLTGDPDSLAAVWQAPSLARRAGREVLRELETTYYDTADLRLRRRGLALRVRRDGQRFVQTIKTENNGQGGLLSRREFSSPVKSSRPEPQRVDDAELRQRIGLILPAELKPVFTTRIERKIRKIRAGGPRQPKALIEVALDQGEVTAKAGRRPISELELELLEGSPDALYDFAVKLNGETPLALETVTKSERGYALALGEEAVWVKAEELILKPEATLNTALGAIFQTCIRHWLANHAAVLEGHDPEGVHQLRVALRRLRSALSVFKPILPAEDTAWINGEARWLIQSLGPARDWDVFLTELLPPLRSARKGNGDLETLAAAAEDARRLGYIKARTALRSARYTTFVLKLGRWIGRAGWRGTEGPGRFEERVADFACRLLRKRHKRVLKEGRDFERLSDEERHRLRITLKKLRYTAEFFASLYADDKTRPYLKALKSLQDELGHLNDVVVAEDLLDSLLGSGDGSNTAALRAAAGMVVGWYTHGVAVSRPGLEGRWRDFAASEPFWSAA